jgi:hypothetical protein
MVSKKGRLHSGQVLPKMEQIIFTPGNIVTILA